MRRDVKPHNKDILVNGIAEFGRLWTRLSAKKYIGHLRKVLPKIIELEGY